MQSYHHVVVSLTVRSVGPLPMVSPTQRLVSSIQCPNPKYLIPSPPPPWLANQLTNRLTVRRNSFFSEAPVKIRPFRDIFLFFVKLITLYPPAQLVSKRFCPQRPSGQQPVVTGGAFPSVRMPSVVFARTGFSFSPLFTFFMLFVDFRRFSPTTRSHALLALSA